MSSKPLRLSLLVKLQQWRPGLTVIILLLTLSVVIGPLTTLAETPQVRLPVPYRTQLDGSRTAGSNCGPASLAMVLAAFGREVPIAQLRATVNDLQGTWNNPSAGTAIQNLGLIGRRHGLDPLDLNAGGRLRRWTFDDLRAHLDSGHPVIPQVWYRGLPARKRQAYNGDHYIVIIGYQGDQFIYHDPIDLEGVGPTARISAEQLEIAWRTSDLPFAAVAFGGPAERPSLRPPSPPVKAPPPPAPTATMAPLPSPTATTEPMPAGRDIPRQPADSNLVILAVDGAGSVPAPAPVVAAPASKSPPALLVSPAAPDQTAGAIGLAERSHRDDWSRLSTPPQSAPMMAGQLAVETGSNLSAPTTGPLEDTLTELRELAPAVAEGPARDAVLLNPLPEMPLPGQLQAGQAPQRPDEATLSTWSEPLPFRLDYSAPAIAIIMLVIGHLLTMLRRLPPSRRTELAGHRRAPAGSVAPAGRVAPVVPVTEAATAVPAMPVAPVGERPLPPRRPRRRPAASPIAARAIDNRPTITARTA